ncbi:O-methyltransferase [Kibdelosporangium aridum]|uniref:O-methyltransferase n=1 Tax=Kibdelosporangium aridum TaxID=2030 RepID=UPI0005246BDF
MAHQLTVTPALADYISGNSAGEDEILARLREMTAELPAGAAMQITAAEGQLLTLLARLTRARLIVEVGTYTGYSALCFARAVRPDGRVITCDITERWVDLGRPYWQSAGVADRIDVRIGNGADTLAALIDELGPGSVDLVFIDADKSGYSKYFEHALTLVHDNGLIVVDNTLYFGQVADPSTGDPDTLAIREFNAALRDDDRVEFCLLPVADGISLVRRRD